MKLLSGDELVTEQGASVTHCLDNDKYIVMMEDYMEVQLPELSDVKLTWLTESGDDTGMESSKVEDVLGWKYIGVNN